MAVLQVIRDLFIPSASRAITVIEPAPPTTYSVHPLRETDLDALLRLNYRCFADGENYTRHTFVYLLTQPNALCFKSLTAKGHMVGFICLLAGEDGTGHITTIGVAPEHRRRGVAEEMLCHMDAALRTRGINSVMLEVRTGNIAAQMLYRTCGFAIVQTLPRYYNNGEDGYLLVKALN